MSDAAASLSGAITRLALEISGLRTDMQALVQGLTLMVETQAVQSDMLQQLLEAASQDGPDESPMEALMRKLTTALDRLTEAQTGTQHEVARLGARMAGAIIRGAGRFPGGLRSSLQAESARSPGSGRPLCTCRRSSGRRR